MIRDLFLPIPDLMAEKYSFEGGPFTLRPSIEFRLPAAIHAWLLDHQDQVEMIEVEGQPTLRFADDAVAAIFWLHWSDEFITAQAEADALKASLLISQRQSHQLMAKYAQTCASSASAARSFASIAAALATRAGDAS